MGPQSLQGEAEDELEVVSVAPSDRALWRLRRLKAQAKGRPRLAARRIAAAAVVAAIVPCDDVISCDEPSAKKRRLGGAFRNSKKVQIHKLAEDLKKARAEISQLGEARAELARLGLEKARCEGNLAAAQRMCQIRISEAEAELTVEKQKRQALERKWNTQSAQCDRLILEKAQLLKQITELQQRLNQQSAPKPVAAAPAPANLNLQALAKQVADMEVRPLRSCNTQVRAALKKRLLVKWHPDKQPSKDHIAMATRVVQEMQNCPEWRA